MHSSHCTAHTPARRVFVHINSHIVGRSSCAIARRSSTNRDLVPWLLSHGGSANGVELAYAHTADGLVERTLRASRVVAPGETLVSVPIGCQLRYTGDQPPQLQQLLQQVPRAAGSSHGAWQFKMAIQLLYQLCQGDASPLATYISHLPGVAPGIPTPGVAMLFSPAAREAFQDAQLAADSEGQWYWCQQFSEDVLRGLPGTPGDPFQGVTITPHLLGWALAVVMSRSFGVRYPGGHVMAPLIDMANHDWKPNAEVQSQEDGRVCMYATQRLEPGQPILLRYGRHSNRDLLLSYGFLAPPPNPFDAYMSPLDVNSTLAAVLQFLGMDLPATGRATDGLKTWQRTCLQELGLLQLAAAGAGAGAAETAGTSSSSSSSSSTVVAPAGETSADVDSAAAVAAAADDSNSSSATSSSSSAGPALRQQQQQQQQLIRLGGDPPINPELLALLRVLLCQDRKMVRGKSLEQLGDWSHPLSATGDALVMKALVGLLTVLYKSSPTTIQQDKQQLAELQRQQQQKEKDKEKEQEQDGMSSTAGCTTRDGAAQHVAPTAALAAAAACALPSEAELLLVAVEYRLQRKQLLEGVMRSCLLRMKELAAAAG